MEVALVSWMRRQFKWTLTPVKLWYESMVGAMPMKPSFSEAVISDHEDILEEFQGLDSDALAGGLLEKQDQKR